MKDNIIKFDNQTEHDAEMLQPIKKEYFAPHMSDEQLTKLHIRMEDAKRDNRRERRKANMVRVVASAAALIAAFVILPNTSPTIAYAMEQLPVIGNLVKVVTFRNYEYESDRHKADIEIPGLNVAETSENHDVQEALEKTADEINAEIEAINTKLLQHFEKYMQDEKGYQEIIVKSEVLTSTQDYFTLKLFCYQGAGSGYQWNYYYTIDLSTGKRLQLKDIFKDGTDYITLISENIKEQMQVQMAEDEMASYWLNNEIDGLNFKAITEETHFYINANGNVVIGFDEGEVAPMYMGAVEFEIPAEVLSDIRK